MNTSNFKVYQKDNSYKVEVTLNEQTMPTAFKQIFMGSSFIEAKLTIYIDHNQITGVTVDITAEDNIIIGNLSNPTKRI